MAQRLVIAHHIAKVARRNTFEAGPQDRGRRRLASVFLWAQRHLDHRNAGRSANLAFRARMSFGAPLSAVCGSANGMSRRANGW